MSADQGPSSLHEIKPTYRRVRTQPEEDSEQSGYGYAVMLTPDALWECQDCYAVVREAGMLPHADWHRRSTARGSQ